MSAIRSRATRLGVIVLCAIGLASIPAHGAPVTVTSAKLASYRTCTLNPLTASSNVGVDTYADEGSGGTTHGTATTVHVTSGATLVLPQNERTYLRFDLTKCSPAIPSSATVSSATLRLFVTSMQNACRTEYIYPATASWTESGLTWNNQPFGTSRNNPSAGSATASMDIGSASGCANRTNLQYVSGWNVTTDVQGFVAGTKTNFGFMIRDSNEVGLGLIFADTVTYSSRDAGTASRAPQLIVNYR